MAYIKVFNLNQGNYIQDVHEINNLVYFYLKKSVGRSCLCFLSTRETNNQLYTSLHAILFKKIKTVTPCPIIVVPFCVWNLYATVTAIVWVEVLFLFNLQCVTHFLEYFSACLVLFICK